MKEFQALRTSLQEGIEDLTESQMLMPPNILILRRQTVRQYPGGLMVALYFNEKLNQYFSIPYGAPNVDSTITPTSLKETWLPGGTHEKIDPPSEAYKAWHKAHGIRLEKTPEELDAARERRRLKKQAEDDAPQTKKLEEEPQVFQNGKWVQDFKAHVYKTHPALKGQIDWEHVDRLHQKGHTPHEAAKRYVQLKENTLNEAALHADRLRSIMHTFKSFLAEAAPSHYNVPVEHGPTAADVTHYKVKATSHAEAAKKALAKHKKAAPWHSAMAPVYNVTKLTEAKQLDELKASTLGSYVKTAAGDLQHHAVTKAYYTKDKHPDASSSLLRMIKQREGRKVTTRRAGITRAAQKLVKKADSYDVTKLTEAKQLDELKSSTLGRYIKTAAGVSEETLDEGVGHYSILKTGTSDSGMTDDEVYDNDGNDGKTTHYNIYHKGNPVGELSHGHYFGQVTGHMHGKPFPDISGYKAFNRSGPQGNLHGFLKSQTGKKWASNLHKYTKEEVEAVNEISIPTATRAFHARQELGDAARSKKKYRAAIYHYAKATKTLDRRAEKYKREDKGETVKEALGHYPGHYGSVGSFATDHGYTFSHHDMGGNHIYKHPSGHRVVEVDDPNGQWHHFAPAGSKVLWKSGQSTKGHGGEDLHKHLVKVHGGIKEAVIQEDAISHLQKVKAFQTDKPLYHKDGSQTRVDPTTAHALLTVHGSMHSENQKKFADALEHSKAKFHKMLDFTWSQVK